MSSNSCITRSATHAVTVSPLSVFAVKSTFAIDMSTIHTVTQQMLAPPTQTARPTSIASSLSVAPSCSKESTISGHSSLTFPTLEQKADPDAAEKGQAPSLHEPREWDLQGSLTVLGASLALFFSFGHMNAFGTYQAWYAQHQLSHLPPSTISWIGGLQIWTIFFSGGIIGRLYDKFGPRWLMLSGTIIHVFSIMMTSICKSYWQYVLTHGFLFGLGVGLLFYPSQSSIATHFRKYRATASGIAMAGSSAGGTVFPILLQRLFARVGFSWGVRIAGFLAFAGCITSVLLVSRRSSQQKAAPPKLTLATFTDLQYILLIIGAGLVAFGFFIPFFYVQIYANTLGGASHPSFYVLAVLNAGSIVGRIAPAYISDLVGRFNTIIPSAFLAGISCLLFWMFAKSFVAVMFFAVVYGLFSGAFISVITPCAMQISELETMGVRIGVLYSIISFPALISGPVAGFLLSRAHGDYTGLILFAGTTMVAGSCVFVWARLTMSRSLCKKV